MEFEGLGWLLAGAGIVGGLKPLCNLIYKLFQLLFRGRDWVKEQDGQSQALEDFKKETNERFEDVYETHNKAVRDIKEEQTLIIYGNLACLKGLAEQGCDGPVHDAIEKIDKYLNMKAHE